MAGASSYVGTGATIAFDASTGAAGAGFYNAQLLGVDWSGISREAIDATHMATDITPGTTEFGNQVFLPADFADGGQLSVEVQFNPDMAPPMVPAVVAASEGIVVTFPLISGDSTAAHWDFEGFCTNCDIDCPPEEIMTATLTLRVTAAVTIVPAA